MELLFDLLCHIIQSIINRVSALTWELYSVAVSGQHTGSTGTNQNCTRQTRTYGHSRYKGINTQEVQILSTIIIPCFTGNKRRPT